MRCAYNIWPDRYDAAFLQQPDWVTAAVLSLLSFADLATAARTSKDMRHVIGHVLLEETQRVAGVDAVFEAPLEATLHPVLAGSVLLRHIGTMDLTLCAVTLADLSACRMALPSLYSLMFRAAPGMCNAALTPTAIARMIFPRTLTHLGIVSGAMSLRTAGHRNEEDPGANFYKSNVLAGTPTDRLDRWIAIVHAHAAKGDVKALRWLALVFDHDLDGHNQLVDLRPLGSCSAVSQLTIYPLECNEAQVSVLCWLGSLSYLDVSLGQWTPELLQRVFWSHLGLGRRPEGPGALLHKFGLLRRIGFRCGHMTPDLLALIPLRGHQYCRRATLETTEYDEYDLAHFDGTLRNWDGSEQQEQAAEEDSNSDTEASETASETAAQDSDAAAAVSGDAAAPAEPSTAASSFSSTRVLRSAKRRRSLSPQP